MWQTHMHTYTRQPPVPLLRPCCGCTCRQLPLPLHLLLPLLMLLATAAACVLPELHDLQDPAGVAQTTVSLLAQKAPNKGLQQFLEAKIEGIQAVVDALLLMHQLAAAVEAPRQAQSAISLVLIWLVLLLACVLWMFSKRSAQ